MGRSWADHGQTMGDRFMQKNPENFSFFRYRFFSKNYENLRFSHSPWTKRLVIFADPVHVFWGKNAFIFDRISILHLGIVCFHNNDSFYTLKPVCFAKICLIPRGRSCLAVRQSLKILFIENECAHVRFADVLVARSVRVPTSAGIARAVLVISHVQPVRNCMTDLERSFCRTSWLPALCYPSSDRPSSRL